MSDTSDDMEAGAALYEAHLQNELNKKHMIITISKLNRQLREGTSAKTGKPYSFESFGIAPLEDKLMDINGDEFNREGRWLNGSTVEGVTESWEEGDKVKVLVIRKKVIGRDGNEKEVINFKLPEGTEPMVEKSKTAPAPDEEEVDPMDF